MEQYNGMQFKLIQVKPNYWVYVIKSEGSDAGMIESAQPYDTEQESRFAAIGHISMLMKGEE